MRLDEMMRWDEVSALEVTSEASLFVEENDGLVVYFARWDDVALN